MRNPTDKNVCLMTHCEYKKYEADVFWATLEWIRFENRGTTRVIVEKYNIVLDPNEWREIRTTSLTSNTYNYYFKPVPSHVVLPIFDEDKHKTGNYLLIETLELTKNE